MPLKYFFGPTFLLSLFFASILSAKPKPNKIRFRELPLTAFHSEPARTALWRYLLSTPQWDVREERGKRFACLTSIDSVSVYQSDGFIRNKKKEVVAKIMIQFHGLIPDKHFDDYTRLSNSSGSVLVSLSSSQLSGLPYQSFCLLGDSSLSISIFEASDQKGRKLTEKILGELKTTLEKVLENRFSWQQYGYLTRPKVTDSISITELSPGYFKVTGNYPFKEEGKIHVRIVSNKGNSLSGKMNQFNSSRPIGWSAESVNFSFMTFATNAEIPPGQKTLAQFEVYYTTHSGKVVCVRKSPMMEISSFDRSEGYR